MIIIANTNSGKGKGKKTLESVKSYLDERFIQYEIKETNAAGHAVELARQASADGESTVVALGGDGTFHEVLNGIDFEKSRLGLIAAGRGNDFIKGTDVSSVDPQKAIAGIVAGLPRDIDYIQVADKRCINVAGTGLDVDVLLKTAHSKNKLSYVASLFMCLLKFKPYHVTVTIDGVDTEYDCIMTGVCNGTQIGSGIRLSPTSLVDDGKLDIIIMEKPKHIPTVFVMPGFVKGKHLNKPYAHHMMCESIHISTNAPIQLDGEIYYDLDFDASVVKGGLKTFASCEQKK